MSSVYDNARRAFDVLRNAMQTDAVLAGDVQGAFRNLLTRYNTQIYENRFIVGGVAERIIAATFVAIGNPVKKLGVHATREDISVGDVRLSVKGSFRPKPTSIRLINVMGDSTKAKWEEPTIFVVSNLGIGYADPDLLPGKTTRAKDVVQLPFKPLKQLWDTRPELLHPLDLPYSREDRDGSDIASRVVADEILRYTQRLRPFDTRGAED